MGQVVVTISGRAYRMACNDGEEARVRELAGYFDAYVGELKSHFQRMQNDQLFLMAALMIADELWEMRDELQAVLMQMSELNRYQLADDSLPGSRRLAEIVHLAASRLEAMSTRPDPAENVAEAASELLSDSGETSY